VCDEILHPPGKLMSSGHLRRLVRDPSGSPGGEVISSRPRSTLFLVLALGLLAVTMPAAATLVLSGATLTPHDLPLVPNQELKLDVKIAIIPSGSTTFARGHTLQIETDLAEAAWSSGVVVDGLPAAQQSARGRVIFINGFLLSYSTNRDVRVEVTVSGTVPEDKVSNITVLRIQELDNGGMPVPEGIITITEPVFPPATVPATGTVPEETTPSPSTTPSPPPSPTKAGGGLSIAGILAAATGGIFYRRNQQRRDT
jgi:hypothetical protein